MADDVADWLAALGLAQYADAFAANHVDLALLADLDDDDLKTLGVASLGHRKRIRAAAAQLAAAPRPAAAASAHAPAQRRQAVMLFADLCGFTELSRGVDPEDLRRLVERFYARADAAIVEAGGAVDKHLGDGVMAIFGAPIAHGDDTLRALRAAQAIHEAMGPLGDELRRTVEVHIGVAAGEVVAGAIGGERHYTVLGDAVNLASRLVGAAGPRETVVAEDVRRIAGESARFEALGERTLKGIDGPVKLWRLVGVDAVRGGSAAPFVGRAAERAQLEGAIQATERERRGRFVLLRGEPGIGKSRLVDEATRTAFALGAAVHKAHALDFGGQQGGVVGQLLRALAIAPGASSPRPLPPETPALLHAALADGLDLPMPAIAETAWQTAGPQKRLAASHDVLALMAELAAGTGMLLLVAEDLHWADAQTLAGIARLARAGVDRPILVFATSRGEGDPLERGLRELLDGIAVSVVDIGPLQAAEAAAFAAGEHGLGDDLLRSCIERAGGNPLYLEQLLRNAAEASAAALPASLRSLLIARVDRLPAVEQAALQTASVLGQRFDAAALAAVLDDAAPQLQTALRVGLVRSEGGMLRFGHALIREGVYMSLLRERRAEIHRRAAAWYADRDLVLRAEHLECAGDDAAPAAFLAAAQAEQRHYRPGNAARLAERGLALAPGAAVRSALLLLRAEALLDGGEARAAQDAFVAALAETEERRDRCRALIGLAGARRVTDALDAAMAALDQAEELAAADDDRVALSQISHMRGNILFPLGRREECAAAHERALVHAEASGSASAIAAALGGLGDVEYLRGRMLAAQRTFERCVSIAAGAGLGRIEVANAPMAAICRLYTLDLASMEREAARAMELARGVGQPRAEMIAIHAALMVRIETGDTQPCDALAERAQEIVRTLGALRFEPENLALLADAHAVAGSIETARGHAERAVAAIRDAATMSFVGPLALAIAARITGDAAAADRHLAEAEAVVAKGGLAHNHLWLRRNGIEIGWGRRDPAMISHHAEALRAAFRDESSPLIDFLCERAAVMACFIRGARDEDWRRRVAALRTVAASRHLVVLDRALAELDRAVAG
ncbi:MAG: AAA family ATPase [Alphaproteobacteria bacterium]|nr:AAA family ATPase [Alphaproteobacteria bacterium]